MMEKNHFSKRKSSSSFQSELSSNSFIVFNATNIHLKLLYNQLLEQPEFQNLMKERRLRKFAVRFSTDRNRASFENSVLGQRLQKRASRHGFVHYTAKHETKMATILREVAEFYPTEVVFAPPRNVPKKTERKDLEESEQQKEDSETGKKKLAQIDQIEGKDDQEAEHSEETKDIQKIIDLQPRRASWLEKMEKTQSSETLSHSLLQMDLPSDSFIVYNATDEYPVASFKLLLEHPIRLREQKVRRFAIKFSTEKDRANFENSQLIRNLKTNTSKKTQSLLPGFIQFYCGEKQTAYSILKIVAQFNPKEVSLDVQRRREKSLSPSKNGSFSNSFTVYNVAKECPKASYNQLLKQPELLKCRTVNKFYVKFSTERDCVKFECSPYGKLLKRRSESERNPIPTGFTGYKCRGSRQLQLILRKVAPFNPIEVEFPQQELEGRNRGKKRFQSEESSEKNSTTELERSPQTQEEAEEIKQNTEVIKFEERDNAEEEIEEESEEEIEPTKMFKNQDNQYIKLKVYKELTMSKESVSQIIMKDPALGENILADLDPFDKLEEEVHNKVQQEIFQEWQWGIKFGEISIREIKQSLKNTKLDHINLRREVFFRRKHELQMLEGEK